MAESGTRMAEKNESNPALLELAIFVMTCARTSIEETQKYSPLRFLEIFKRVSELPNQVRELKLEPILNDVCFAMDRLNKERQLETDEQRVEFTDKMTKLLVAELKKRAGL